MKTAEKLPATYSLRFGSGVALSSLNSLILSHCSLLFNVNDLTVSHKAGCNCSSGLEGKIYSMLEAGFAKWATLPTDFALTAAFIMQCGVVPA